MTAFVVAAVFIAVACDPAFEVCGRVQRCSDGAPLVGVHVRLTKDGGELVDAHSDPDGKFCGGNVGDVPDGYDATYEKPGFRSENRAIAGRASQLPDVCLMTETCTAAGTCPKTSSGRVP